MAMNLLPILMGILTSGMLVVPAVKILVSQKGRIARLWCRPWRIPIPGQRSRLKMALLHPWSADTILLIPGILVAAVWGIVRPEMDGMTLALFGLGYVPSVLLFSANWMQDSMMKLKEELILQASRRLDGPYDSATAESLLIRALEAEDPRSKAIVLDELRRTGTLGKMKELEHLSQSWDLDLQVSSRRIVQEFEAHIAAHELPSLNVLVALWKQYKVLMDDHAHRYPTNAEDRENRLDELKLRIDGVARSQAFLMKAYPDLYCDRCGARTEKVTRNLWSWVQCKHCSQADMLILGIKEVVGQIGNPAPVRLVDGKLHVNLWNPLEKEVRYAEIDRLEVFGGQDMDYDWAVSAVVENLRNHRGLEGIDVRLVGSPALEENTLRLLTALDSKLMGGAA